MSRFLTSLLTGLVAAGATFATLHSANAGCTEDVAAAFAKQRALTSFRMKTRQISQRGLINMTVDYLLPYKMHQTVKVVTQPGSSQLILVGARSWYSTGLKWTLMSRIETSGLIEQLQTSVIDPPADPLKYECLGLVDLDGRSLIAYQGKQGRSENVSTDTFVLRTVYIDPKSGLPVRSTVARASKPDVAFFKADYSYPDDIVIEPPKNVNPPQPATAPAQPTAPNQSTTPAPAPAP